MTMMVTWWAYPRVKGCKGLQLRRGLGIHEALHCHRHSCLLLACQQVLHTCNASHSSVFFAQDEQGLLILTIAPKHVVFPCLMQQQMHRQKAAKSSFSQSKLLMRACGRRARLHLWSGKSTPAQKSCLPRTAGGCCCRWPDSTALHRWVLHWLPAHQPLSTHTAFSMLHWCRHAAPSAAMSMPRMQRKQPLLLSLS